MSFDGQVLCQRMLIGPWALTTVGAATAVAALAAATFRKRRRVEVLSLVGLFMGVSRLDRSLVGRPLLVDANSRGRARALARIRYTNAALGCGAVVSSTPWVGTPMAPAWVTRPGNGPAWRTGRRLNQVLLPAAVATTGRTSLAARSGVSSFQRTEPNGRSSMRRTRIGSGPRRKAIALWCSARSDCVARLRW